MSNHESIILLGLDVDLFKSCFFPKEEEPVKSKQWASHKLILLDDESATASADLSDALQKPGVLSVVFQDTELNSALLNVLKQFYDAGGLVVFFGIYGNFSDPSRLSKQFALPEAWSFSAYTKHKYEITSTAMDSIGYSVTEQEYTKSNLLRVPVQDRWMVAKPQPLHQYVEELAGCLDGDAPDEDWKCAAKKAKSGYVNYCEELYEQCPLAVHKNDNDGRLAYLGFVNGDDSIPKIVRALVTKKKIPTHHFFMGWK